MRQTRISSPYGLLLPAAFLLAAFLAGAAPALAQNRDMQSLIDQVGRMQQDLADLQRTVYRGGAASGGSAAPAPSGGGDSGQAVSNLYRMNEIERQIADLTGRVEETQYGVQRLNDRLEKLSSDIDFRLSRLEQASSAGGASDANGAAADAPRTAPAADAAADTAGGNRTAGGTMNEDRAPKVLGTLPQGEGSASRQQSAAAPPAAAAAGSPQEAYDQAFQTLVRQDFPAAEQQFKGFLQRYGDNALAGNAQYWLAETHYVRGQYEQAAVAFAEGFQKYPKNAKAPDNLLKLGLSLSALKRKEDACVAFGELGKQYPNAAQNIKRRAQLERQKLNCG